MRGAPVKPLTHYVVVRRDLSVGVLLAMVAHAAGESFYKLANPQVSVAHTTMASGGYAAPGGGLPASGSYTFTLPAIDPATTIAVVLGARNEGRLLKLERVLEAAGVAHVAIRETDGEHAGQLMAIGLVPGEKEQLSPLVNEFHMLREVTNG